MSIAEFKSIRKILKLLFSELEKEALAEGIDTESEEWAIFLLEIKTGFLERFGITAEEYDAINADIKNKKKLDLIKEFQNVPEILSEDRIREISGEVLKTFKPKIPAPQIINKIVRVVEKPQIIETKEIVREINKEDLLKLQSDFADLFGKMAELQIPSKEDVINWTIRNNKAKWEKTDDKLNLVRQTISRMVWGLSDEIDKLKQQITTLGTTTLTGELIDLSSQCNGVLTEFALGKTVIAENWTKLNGTFIEVTLNAARNSITLAFAPEAGEELKTKVFV